MLRHLSRFWIILLGVIGISVPGLVLCAPPFEDASVIRVGKDYPDFASAVAAVPAIRTRSKPDRPIVIELPSGVTRLTVPVRIDAAHGGTPTSPLIIRGASDGSSQLVGSVSVAVRPSTSTDFYGKPVPPGTRTIALGNIDTPEHGLRERGVYVENEIAGIEVYQGEAQLWNARWPNRGFVPASLIRTDSKNSGPMVRFPDGRHRRWANEPDMWIGGRWARDWDFEMGLVRELNPANGDIGAAARTSKIPPRKAPQLFVANALGELDTPGEYVVDSKRKQVVFLPIGGAGGTVEVAVARSLLVFRGAQNVQIEGIGFKRTLGAAVRIGGSARVHLDHCVVAQTGGNGIEVYGGNDVTISNTVVNGVAETGIVLQGGDRQSLTAARHRVIDSIIANFGTESPDYNPGVRISGVGIELRDSLIAGGAHAGVIASGNDNRVVGNEVTRVALASNDVGAIYMGRDWTQRGNEIRGNFIHDFGQDSADSSVIAGVYLDDLMSGVLIEGNVISGGAFGAIIRGGRENVVRGNVFVRPSRAALRFDKHSATTLSTARPGQNASMKDQLMEKLEGVPVNSNAWRDRYPELAGLDPSQLATPEGNEFTDNAVLGAPTIDTRPSSLLSMIHQSRVIIGPAPDSGSPDEIQSVIARDARLAALADVVRRPSQAVELCRTLPVPDSGRSAEINPNIKAPPFAC